MLYEELEFTTIGKNIQSRLLKSVAFPLEISRYKFSKIPYLVIV